MGSLYKAELRLKGAQMLAISQSGASPDLIALAKAGTRGGAVVAALLNVIPSPLAEMADTVLPIAAGPERAVAATKSFVATLVALCTIHAAHADDSKLHDDLQKLPTTLASVLRHPETALEEVERARYVVCLDRATSPSASLRRQPSSSRHEHC